MKTKSIYLMEEKKEVCEYCDGSGWQIEDDYGFDGEHIQREMRCECNL